MNRSKELSAKRLALHKLVECLGRIRPKHVLSGEHDGEVPSKTPERVPSPPLTVTSDVVPPTTIGLGGGGPGEKSEGYNHLDPAGETSTTVHEHNYGGAPVEDETWPTLEEVGKIGTYYFLRDPDWVVRHVESVTFKNKDSARRRLTIDILLPHDPLCMARRHNEERLYFVPAAPLAKTPTNSYIDLVDETDRSLPLLTREENASISYAALILAATQLIEDKPSKLLEGSLRALVYGNESALALAVAQGLIAKGYPQIQRHEGFMRILRILAANSIIWLPLLGRPGERRIVKLRYDTPLYPPSIVPRREQVTYVTVLVEDGEHNEHELLDLKITEPGDDDPRTTLHRMLNRVLNAMGFAPLRVSLITPYIHGSVTYHLQVASPPGVDIRALYLLAELEPGPDSLVDVESDCESAHLYMVNTKVRGLLLPAVTEFRVGRRGFLSMSTLSAIIITAMLWGYDTAAPIKETGTRYEVAATGLLLLPTLLIAFVVRLGEHAFATRLLSGVRFCILLLGLLAVADVAALAGVKPEGLTIHEVWFVYAVAASVVSGVLILSWLVALETSARWAAWLRERWKSRLLYIASCVAAMTLATLVVATGAEYSGAATWIIPLGASLPGVMALICWTVAMTSANGAREAPLSAALCALVGLASASAALVLLTDGFVGIDWNGVWRALTIGMLTLLLFLPISVGVQAIRERASS